MEENINSTDNKSSFCIRTDENLFHYWVQENSAPFEANFTQSDLDWSFKHFQ